MEGVQTEAESEAEAEMQETESGAESIQWKVKIWNFLCSSTSSFAHANAKAKRPWQIIG